MRNRQHHKNITNFSEIEVFTKDPETLPAVCLKLQVIKNIRDLGISTISEINDFINSFNEIIDKIYDYSPIDGICVELFKKAKLFEICIEHLKSGKK